MHRKWTRNCSSTNRLLMIANRRLQRLQTPSYTRQRVYLDPPLNPYVLKVILSVPSPSIERGQEDALGIGSPRVHHTRNLQAANRIPIPCLYTPHRSRFSPIHREPPSPYHPSRRTVLIVSLWWIASACVQHHIVRRASAGARPNMPLRCACLPHGCQDRGSYPGVDGHSDNSSQREVFVTLASYEFVRESTAVS
jgi:hypothetical protein